MCRGRHDLYSDTFNYVQDLDLNQSAEGLHLPDPGSFSAPGFWCVSFHWRLLQFKLPSDHISEWKPTDLSVEGAVTHSVVIYLSSSPPPRPSALFPLTLCSPLLFILSTPLCWPFHYSSHSPLQSSAPILLPPCRYKKTQETLTQAGQKTSAALSTVGTAITRRLGDMRYDAAERRWLTLTKWAAGGACWLRNMLHRNDLSWLAGLLVHIHSFIHSFSLLTHHPVNCFCLSVPAEKSWWLMMWSNTEGFPTGL